MTAAPEAVEPEARAEIERRLAAVAARDRVTVLLAVESGSRAWGFPSPDSDYDARFVYVRPAAWYVSVAPGRDVIEEEVGEYDVNGWDLRKALGLMLKGNAVLVEWLMSPLVYAEQPGFRDGFSALLAETARPAPLLHHYLSLGRSMRANDAFRGESIPIKKYFYVLRPAIALRWLRVHGWEALPPMHLPTLAADCDLPDTVAGLLAELIAAKARTRELGATAPIALLDSFIDEEFAAAERSAARLPPPPSRPTPDIDGFLRRWAFGNST